MQIIKIFDILSELELLVKSAECEGTNCPEIYRLDQNRIDARRMFKLEK